MGTLNGALTADRLIFVFGDNCSDDHHLLVGSRSVELALTRTNITQRYEQEKGRNVIQKQVLFLTVQDTV